MYCSVLLCIALYYCVLLCIKDVGAAAGGAAWENAVEEDRQRVRDEGAAAWYEASEEKNDRFSWVYKSSFEG